jgi:N-acetylglucosamine malate deacetylase 1
VVTFRSMPVSRRNLLASAGAAPLMGSLKGSSTADTPSPRLKVVVTGGHPGDPECGCGGTIARYTALGHAVTLLYLNHGEGFCGKASLNECAAIRTAEARKACEILKAHPTFAGQHDGQAIVDNQRYSDFRRLLDAERPDVVFTHWPVDRHRDHRALSLLVLDAWLESGKPFALYYYEVADDTMMFSPVDYVDITPVESTRRAACFSHSSQEPGKWYPAQQQITRFRGVESGHSEAEAFVRHWQSKSALLP